MLVELLSKQSGISVPRLNYTAHNASERYKLYKIAKRRGGTRDIAHPSRQLKAIQRWINTALFSNLPIHESATAYKRGASIKLNAMAHVGSYYTTRIDFEDFFHSFNILDIKLFLQTKNREKNLELSRADINFISKIVCRNGQLTIGAPSSPYLTNCMMFEFDEQMAKICTDKGAIYTRYADDIFVSGKTKDSIANIELDVKQIVETIDYLNLQINPEKTRHLGKKFKRQITGLVLTSDNKISLGRDRKRYIKSLVFRYKENHLQKDELLKLRGLISFASDVEPAFKQTLLRKYGDTIIDDIMGTH